MSGLNPFVNNVGGNKYAYYDEEDEDNVDKSDKGREGDDMFGGKKLDTEAVRVGYDSYSIYDVATGKTTGRYISKTPASAASKAARRIFKKMSVTGPKARKVAPKVKKAKKVAAKKGGYNDMLMDGGAKKADTSDLFEEGGEEIDFYLKKTTRGADSGSLFYHYSATLRHYKEPLVVNRGGVEVPINYKIFVTRLEIPEEMKEAEKTVKLNRKLKNDDEYKDKLKAKKEAEKEKKTAKKAAEKEKAKKAAEKEKAKKAAEKEKEKAKKAAEKEKAKKAAEKEKAKKAAEKPKAKKTKKTKKVTGGGCSSCSMYY